MEGLERGLSYFFSKIESQKNPGGRFGCKVVDIRSRSFSRKLHDVV